MATPTAVAKHTSLQAELEEELRQAEEDFARPEPATGAGGLSGPRLPIPYFVPVDVF